jgi:hypothetical protein
VGARIGLRQHVSGREAKFLKMAHLLTDEEILAAMELGSEDMRLDEAEAAIKPAVYDRAYRDLMAVNGQY